MKEIEVTPSDFTNDEIYRASEYLVSCLEKSFLELDKLEKLNKMYTKINELLVVLNLKQEFSCTFPQYQICIKWDPNLLILYVSDVSLNKGWNIHAAPKGIRLVLEIVMPEFLRALGDSLK